MRLRSLLLVLAAAVVVVFALLNWTEFSRPVPLNLGWRTVSGPLPLVLLGLLALAAVAGLASGAVRESHHRRLEQEQADRLQAQRELAERAEASRFTDLRQLLDQHLRETRQREAASETGLDQAMGRAQRDLRSQLELLHRSIAARLGEMEARLEARLAQTERALAQVRPGGPAAEAAVEPAAVAPRAAPRERLGQPEDRSETARP